MEVSSHIKVAVEIFGFVACRFRNRIGSKVMAACSCQHSMRFEVFVPYTSLPLLIPILFLNQNLRLSDFVRSIQIFRDYFQRSFIASVLALLTAGCYR